MCQSIPDSTNHLMPAVIREWSVTVSDARGGFICCCEVLQPCIRICFKPVYLLSRQLVLKTAIIRKTANTHVFLQPTI